MNQQTQEMTLDKAPEQGRLRRTGKVRRKECRARATQYNGIYCVCIRNSKSDGRFPNTEDG